MLLLLPQLLQDGRVVAPALLVELRDERAEKRASVNGDLLGLEGIGRELSTVRGLLGRTLTERADCRATAA